MRSNLSDILLNLPDQRQPGKIDYSIHDAVMSGFACMYFQDPSLKAFQERLNDDYQMSNLHTIFGVNTIPSDTQLRDIVDNLDSEAFRPVFKDSFSRIQRGKFLEQYQIFPNCYYVAMDASQYFASNNIHCENCLRTNHDNGTVTYSHKVLMPAIMHPGLRQVIPLMPEEICNSDGSTKQDCETNAAKRLIPKIKKDHPKLDLILGGDDIYSRQPMIMDVLDNGWHYLFVAKPDSHAVMMRYIENQTMNKKQFVDKKGKIHLYEWINNVPLNGNKESIQVNYCRYTQFSKDKDGNEKKVYSNSWVTDITVEEENVKTLTKTGRCRWKIENECFNTLKNQGYCIEHNYGHGKKNLCFNFLLLTLIAFTFHQILELTDKLYQACRKKFGSKWHMWETLRTYIKILIFDSWEHLLDFALDPIKYNPSICGSP
jgi:hypothetical protein